MSIRAYVAAVGVLIALYGTLFMFLGVTVHNQAGRQVECGSAAIAASTTTFTDDAVCSEALSARRAWTFPVLLGGLVVVAGGLLVRRPRNAKTVTAT